MTEFGLRFSSHVRREGASRAFSCHCRCLPGGSMIRCVAIPLPTNPSLNLSLTHTDCVRVHRNRRREARRPRQWSSTRTRLTGWPCEDKPDDLDEYLLCKPTLELCRHEESCSQRVTHTTHLTVKRFGTNQPLVPTQIASPSCGHGPTGAVGHTHRRLLLRTVRDGETRGGAKGVHGACSALVI